MIRILPLIIFVIVFVIVVVQLFLVPLYKKFRNREEEINDGVSGVEKKISQDKRNKK